MGNASTIRSVSPNKQEYLPVYKKDDPRFFFQRKRISSMRNFDFPQHIDEVNKGLLNSDRIAAHCISKNTKS
jgi:hypothetical protein